MPWVAFVKMVAAPLVVALVVGMPPFLVTLDRLNEQSKDQDAALAKIELELARVRDATEESGRINDLLNFTVTAVQRTLDEVARRANSAAAQEDLDDLEKRLEDFMDSIAPRALPPARGQ